MRKLQSKLLPEEAVEQPCKRASGKMSFDRSVKKQVDILAELVDNIIPTEQEVRKHTQVIL